MTGLKFDTLCLQLYFPAATSTSPKRLLIAKLISWLPAAALVQAVAGSMEGNERKQTGQRCEGSRSM